MLTNVNTPTKFFFLVFCLNSTYWVTTQLHAKYCAPYGFWGILSTPIMMGSPICHFMVKIISHTSEIYATIWIGLVGMIVTSVYDFITQNGLPSVKK